MVASSIQCFSAKSYCAFLGLFFVYTVACIIPIPVMQFVNFFESIVIDNNKRQIKTSVDSSLSENIPLVTFM